MEGFWHSAKSPFDGPVAGPWFLNTDIPAGPLRGRTDSQGLWIVYDPNGQPQVDIVDDIATLQPITNDTTGSASGTAYYFLNEQLPDTFVVTLQFYSNPILNEGRCQFNLQAAFSDPAVGPGFTYNRFSFGTTTELTIGTIFITTESSVDTWEQVTIGVRPDFMYVTVLGNTYAWFSAFTFLPFQFASVVQPPTNLADPSGCALRLGSITLTTPAPAAFNHTLLPTDAPAPAALQDYALYNGTWVAASSTLGLAAGLAAITHNAGTGADDNFSTLYLPMQSGSLTAQVRLQSTSTKGSTCGLYLITDVTDNTTIASLQIATNDQAGSPRLATCYLVGPGGQIATGTLNLATDTNYLAKLATDNGTLTATIPGSGSTLVLTGAVIAPQALPAKGVHILLVSGHPTGASFQVLDPRVIGLTP